MTAKRFEATGFNPELNEYEIRYPGEQQYTSITMEDLEKVLLDMRSSGCDFIGGLRFRTKDSVDKFTQVDRKDAYKVLDCISAHLHGDATSSAPEVLEDDVPYEPSEDIPESRCEPECECADESVSEEEEGAVFRFCCHPMMKAMLGGSGAVVISMETGELQLGVDAMHFCPFCGRAITTYAPPMEVIPPEE